MKTATARLTPVCISLIVLGLMFTAQGSAEIDLESAIGIWLFDEGTGNIAKDTSGKDNHGNLMNNPKWVQGKFNARAIARAKALEFDGNDDWVDCGNDDTLSVLTGDASVVAWIKFRRAVRTTYPS